MFTMCVVWGNVVAEDAEDAEDGAGIPGGGAFGPCTLQINASASWATSFLLVAVSSVIDVVSNVIAAALVSSASALPTAALARALKGLLVLSVMSSWAFCSASAYRWLAATVVLA